MNKILIIAVLSGCLAAPMKCLSQRSIHEKINGVFKLKGDTCVKLIIHNDRFAFIDSRKKDHLATPCCDTITFGDVSSGDKGFLRFDSDPSLNSIFVGMSVVEKKDDGTDSIAFNIRNPIEDGYKKNKSAGGELIYKLLVQPRGEDIGYFKENNQPFESGYIRFYNPSRRGIIDFTITIDPKMSIYVKDIAVRELQTLTYTVKNKAANVFEIYIPQLSYGFIGYRRLKGAYAKLIDQNTILWEDKENIRE